MEGKERTYVDKEPGGGNWSRGLWRNDAYCLCPHFLPSYSICPSHSELGPQCSIQTVYHKISHRPVWWGHFFNSGFLFPSGSCLCQIDKKLASTLILQGELIHGHTEEFSCLILVCLWRMAMLQLLIQDSTLGSTVFYYWNVLRNLSAWDFDYWTFIKSLPVWGVFASLHLCDCDIWFYMYS